MAQFEIIHGCEVYSYEIKNDDIYDSDINEQMLTRHRRSKEIDRECAKFSPTAAQARRLGRIA
ncbi:MAG: hypothetical protein IJQ37_00005 [Clostridia bacterium]|nr:hypothetical protein [Clostridia bacterium]